MIRGISLIARGQVDAVPLVYEVMWQVAVRNKDQETKMEAESEDLHRRLAEYEERLKQEQKRMAEREKEQQLKSEQILRNAEEQRLSLVRKVEEEVRTTVMLARSTF